MRPADVWELLRPRDVARGRQARVLGRCHDLDDLRAAARRRLPRAVFDYVDGGADEEATLAANRRAFRGWWLRPRIARDVSACRTGTTLLGRDLPVPLGLAPTGYTRMVHPDGEKAVARAAAARHVPYAVSTMASTAIQDVATAAPADLWCQLYLLRDRARSWDLLDRARGAGASVLAVSVDTAVSGRRTRDVRNGLVIPPRLTARTLLGLLARPGYWTRMLRAEPLAFPNLGADPGNATVAGITDLFDASMTWDDIADIRARWDGTLLLKGPVGPADAKRAVSLGVDGIHLSNHGGRQLDRCVPTAALIRPVRAAIGERPVLVVDSGIWHGMDVAVALALGADLAMVGKAYLYGLAVAGEAGVGLVLDVLTDQFRRTLGLLGLDSAEKLRGNADVLSAHTDLEDADQ